MVFYISMKLDIPRPHCREREDSASVLVLVFVAMTIEEGDKSDRKVVTFGTYFQSVLLCTLNFTRVLQIIYPFLRTSPRPHRAGLPSYHPRTQVLHALRIVLVRRN